MQNTFSIEAEDAGKRLDVFFVQQLGDSRAKIQAMIKAGDVTVNGEIVRAPHRFLKEGDDVRIVPVQKATVEPLPADSASRTLASTKPIALDIIFENDDVLVVNKPAGVLIHPTATSHEPTLMDATIAHAPHIARVGDDPAHRAGIVHRLDRDASGVLIMAKTQAAFQHLKQQFKARSVIKEYRVLVEGRMKPNSGTIRGAIARSHKDGQFVARPSSQEGHEAITHFDVVTRYANATELSVRIETGRTHQIRVHLTSLGHPVAGDTLYTIRGMKRLPFPRLWLHAESLMLVLPGEHAPRTFSAPLPTALTNFTRALHTL